MKRLILSLVVAMAAMLSVGSCTTKDISQLAEKPASQLQPAEIEKLLGFVNENVVTARQYTEAGDSSGLVVWMDQNHDDMALMNKVCSQLSHLSPEAMVNSDVMPSLDAWQHILGFVPSVSR